MRLRSVYRPDGRFLRSVLQQLRSSYATAREGVQRPERRAQTAVAHISATVTNTDTCLPSAREAGMTGARCASAAQRVVRGRTLTDSTVAISWGNATRFRWLNPSISMAAERVGTFPHALTHAVSRMRQR